MPALKSESYLKSKTQNHVPDLKSERENLAVPVVCFHLGSQLTEKNIFLTIYVRKCLRSAEGAYLILCDEIISRTCLLEGQRTC